MWLLVICTIILLGFGFILSKMYGVNMKMEEGYAIGALITIVLMSIFKGFKFDKNLSMSLSFNKNITLLALITAFLGSSLWFVGEYLTYTGQEEHPLLDPLGAFATSVSALITLLVFVMGK